MSSRRLSSMVCTSPLRPPGARTAEPAPTVAVEGRRGADPRTPGRPPEPRRPHPAWQAAPMADEKPVITIPDSEPPPVLVVEDLEVGTGDEPVPGQDVTVHYVGVAWSTGEQFDASWDRGETFRFGFGV